jgi:hypothetical protein
MAVTIQIRRGTAAEWTAANTVLAAGELGYETDTGYIKVGDGSTAWNSVAYSVEGSTGDITVTTNAASGGGALSYTAGTTTFSYTPPDLSSLIELTDISIGTDAAPSGSGGIAYDNTTGVFTFTPPVTQPETTTSIAKVGNELRYTDEDGTVTTIDLSLYLDDTNLARLASGTVDGVTGIATFTRDDASTLLLTLVHC